MPSSALHHHLFSNHRHTSTLVNICRSFAKSVENIH